MQLSVGRGLGFACALHIDTILQHQATDTAMANIQTRPLQLLGDAQLATTAQAQARLLLDMCYNNHICPLPLTGGALSKGTKDPSTDLHDLTETCSGKGLSVFLDKSELQNFRLAKNTVAFLNTPLLLENTVLTSKSLTPC